MTIDRYTVFPDVFLTISKNGTIINTTGDASFLWGAKADVLIGSNILDFFAEADQKLISAFLDKKNPSSGFSTKTTITNNDTGENTPVKLAIVPVDNALTGIIISATNQSKELNHPVYRVSELSHELKNPLNSIIGLSNLLLHKNPRKDQYELIQTLKFSAENLNTLINDILDYSRIKAGKIEIEHIDFNLELLLKSLKISFKDAAESKGLRLSVTNRGQTPAYVEGDSTRLSQILYNLVGNSIKFTNEGSVSIEVSSKTHEKGHEIRFKVSDTGIGIAKDRLTHIFQPYEQARKDISRRFGGTGLGLSIIKKLVDMMEGTIEVESEEGKGSSFSVTLPFGKAETAPQTENRPQRISHLNDAKLLYVEDVKSNQLLIKEYCAIANIDTQVAFNGKEAMAKLSDKGYDLILLDLNLPGEDGFEIARKIRNLPESYYKNIPIIAVTAENTYQVKNKIKNFGFNDIILKPVNPEELFQKITQYLGSARVSKKKVSSLKHQNVNLKLLDALFQEKPEEYVSLLSLMMQEYKKYRKSLLFAVRHRDLKGYRKTVHNMRSNLSTLGMNDFLDYLNEAKKQLQELPLEADATGISNELSDYFRNIILVLEDKINELASSRIA